MLHQSVAPGIHRVHDAFVNWYLIEADDGGRSLTVVDAGVPGSWRSARAALAALGRTAGDVEALVLTHAHFDHVGFAERARREWEVPVLVHERDASLTRHPLFYEHEHAVVRQVRHPSSLVVLGAMLARGAAFTRGVGEVRTFADGDVLDVPGRPRVIFTPGHTHGHVALHLPDRGAVVAGDALVTLNPYTGDRGPRIVSGAATADSPQALASLDRLGELDARTLLPGHGNPWSGDLAQAVARAREVGPS